MFTILAFWTTIAFVTVSGKVTDKQYASLPEIFQVENYDSCMLHEKALYCYINFELMPIDEQHPPELWNIIKELNSTGLRYKHELIRQFICITKTCPNVTVLDNSNPKFIQELQDCLNNIYKSYHLKGVITDSKCRTSEPLYATDKVDYIVTAILIIYVGFVLVLSFYDLYKRYETEEDYHKFKESQIGKLVTSFSIPSNWNKLKSFPNGTDFDKLKSIQGIRVYMTFMVIGVHSCLATGALPSSNPNFLEELNENPTLMMDFPKRGIFVLAFHFMTSTWIVMNAMLTKVDKNEKMNFKFVIQSIVKRYVRFMPMVAFTVAFFGTWLRHVPMGPYWSRVCEEVDRCRENWWTNLLFIQNFVHRYRMCHIVSWFLAVEMHYYIISMFLIMIMVNHRNKIPHILSLLLSISVLFGFWDHYRHGYSSTVTRSPEEIFALAFNTQPQWHDHFASYHANFSGSIVGLWFGYYYYKFKNQELFTSKTSRLLWWVSVPGLLIGVVCLPFLVDVDKTLVHAAAYVAISRPIFSIGMGLLVLGISHGLGGFLKWMFEWSPLQILAKLSFVVYIAHPMFQTTHVAVLRNTIFTNYYLIFTDIFADIIVAFLAGVPLSLFFEMPAHETANRLFKSTVVSDKKKM